MGVATKYYLGGPLFRSNFKFQSDLFIFGGPGPPKPPHGYAHGQIPTSNLGCNLI